MRDFLCDAILPYKGTTSFKFGDAIEDIRILLKRERVPFNQTVDSNKGCMPEIPWTFITIDESITLCFVEGILFEIVLENSYSGCLPNGGCIGMDMSELEARDASLEYNDDEEDYASEEGYWVSDDIDTGKVMSITIYIPEIEEDGFFEYDWGSRYTEKV